MEGERALHQWILVDFHDQDENQAPEIGYSHANEVLVGQEVEHGAVEGHGFRNLG